MSEQNLNYLLKVTIFPTSKIDERSGISQKTGKDWLIRTQEAYIDLGAQFPILLKLPLKKDQVPYAPGEYYVVRQSFKVGSYGDLLVGDIVLAPISSKS
ncbi:single-stranded DNA-binding protein [Aggregatibacter actinomycetemcomitans]|uniref:single-stranded DNA-binding protein n=1 Tax=Aggregatibacter actinomycetemcomitans TaxID=714 RepID=UPI00197C7DD9|nr:single-stranded DNA-binding protein [Aggregatibacter actinomycetemcomitans]MBN6078540.1 DNA-binding protein [Aggregatibacter actinomycetemcomitans]